MLTAVFFGATAGAEEVLAIRSGELQIALGEKPTSVEKLAAQLFAHEVARRTGIEVSISDLKAVKHQLIAGTAESSTKVCEYSRSHPEAARLAADGFYLATAPDSAGKLYVVGQSPSGVIAGMGKLLRLSRYADSTLRFPCLTLASSPRMPIRGIYFATHFYNFYHTAPLEEVDRIIEDFALWGGNSLVVCFDMHHFKSFQDPAAQAHAARLKHFGQSAHAHGVKFGIPFIANEAYAGSPAELRADARTGRAHYHVELCPSKPQGLELIKRWQGEVLDAFPLVDFLWTWPYDQGGCACELCKPWGANGYLRASEQLARLYHQRFPRGQFWLSTWLFDYSRNEGEYAGLLRVLRQQQPAWITGILAGTHGDWLPKPLFGRPSPERYPLTSFPEISMYGMSPWGGCGANPLPDFCSRLATNLRGHIVGGWPYSEGIYEDLNKFFWTQFYWNPDRTTDDILAEYAAYYFSPLAAADAVKLFHLLEKTHARKGLNVRNLAGADNAWALAQAIDARLAPWAKTSWRWRVVYVRAAIDHVLMVQGAASPEAQTALRPLLDELCRIYRVTRATLGCVHPARLPRPRVKRPREAANLAIGRPVKASSTQAEFSGSQDALVDGVLAEDDPQNFWVQDAAQEKTASLVIDLGRTVAVKEVRLQFRQIHGVFWFVPTTVSFAVSDDGKQFVEVSAAKSLPKEGTAYSPRFWSYPINRSARHVRMNLGPSQRAGDQFAGTLELTEIEVIGDEKGPASSPRAK